MPLLYYKDGFVISKASKLFYNKVSLNWHFVDVQ